MFKKIALRSTGILASLVVGLVGVAAAAPSAQAYTPTNGKVSFNNAAGTSKKYSSNKFSLIRELDKAINATPRGATITMAMYLFDRPTTARALIAAHRRGVNVQILLDNGEKSKESGWIRKELGRNKAAKSFVTTCSGGCMTHKPGSVMHAKLYLFSQSGAAKNVSMVSSGNPHYVNSYNSFNNNHTKTNDAVIYNGLRKYFLDMISNRINANYFRTVDSGDWKLYFFPKALVNGQNVSPSLDVLNHVGCTGVAKGYGSGGRTVIRVGMWGWTSARNDIARRLWALHNAGCKVDVHINTGRMSRSTLQILLKPSSRYGKMKVYDYWRDKNRNDMAERYIHHKMFEINGRWFGNGATKIVYTGSQNWTSTGTYLNNDILLRIKNAGVYNAYSKNLSYIKRYATRLYYAPAVMNPAREGNGKGDRRMAPAAPTLAENGVGSDLQEDESWQFDREG